MAVPLFSAIDKSIRQFCESKVSKGFRKTFGDNDDVAHRCLDCDTEKRITEGSAADQDVPDAQDPADPDAGINFSKTPALPDGGERR